MRRVLVPSATIAMAAAFAAAPAAGAPLAAGSAAVGAAADAASLAIPVACWVRDRHGRRHRVACRHRYRAMPYGAPAPYYLTPDIPDRPPWATNPNECWLNEGYGRWRSCSAGGGFR